MSNIIKLDDYRKPAHTKPVIAETFRNKSLLLEDMERMVNNGHAWKHLCPVIEGPMLISKNIECMYCGKTEQLESH